MTTVELALAAARLLHLAGLIQSFGALVFLLAVARTDSAGAAAITRLTAAGLVVSIGGGLLWLVFQSLLMLGEEWHMLAGPWTVLIETRFGEVFGLRLGLLLAAFLLLLWRSVPAKGIATLLLGAGLALQPGLGHGAAAEDWFLPVATSLHVLAAGAWLGALLPLWSLLLKEPRTGAIAARRFSPLGFACVCVLAASAAGQWSLIGDVPRLVGTGYGRIVLVKLALFLMLFGFAAANRFRFVPRALAGGADANAGLRRSVAAETVTGLLVIAAAALLASLPPAAHEQPVWPFPIRPVPTLLDDAFLRDRIIRTLRPVVIAAALLAAALVWRRGRWLLIGAAALALLWIPDFPLKPYYRSAFPTTFQQWERGRTPGILALARQLFLAECADCHATDGRGRGPKATGKPVWPPNITAPLYGRERDGDLFWNIRAGMTTTEGIASMPGFGDRLADDEIWMLVDFIRARASAESLDAAGRWSQPTRAPDMSIACGPEGEIADLAAGDGTMLLVEAAESPAVKARAFTGTTPIRTCPLTDTAQRSEWLQAVGILTDREGTAPAGASVLIDGRGWLRRIWRAPPSTAEIEAEAERALSQPVAASSGTHH